MLFNIFSYMNNELLCAGNTVAAIDELYLYLNKDVYKRQVDACVDFGAEETQAKQNPLCGILRPAKDPGQSVCR